MSSSPARHSQASLSTSNHSSQRSIQQEETPLETLVSHLLASKRSLSSINAVWRANQIVTSSRSALEESVVLQARTDFVRHGILDQVKLLKQVRASIEIIYNDGQRDFKNVIRTLDAANARLEHTMDLLRSTLVQAAFRPAEETPRSLLDFVDEQGVEAMRDMLKDSIRDARETQTAFDSTMLAFDDDLRSLKQAGGASFKPSTSQPQVAQSSIIPDHLRGLEEHAQEMAGLLESLTSHFDLCVNAIRHTEGGFAAVRKAASNPPPGAEPVSVSGVISSSGEQVRDMEPISDKDREDMLRVVETDAAQVNDVVNEIRARLNDMEIKREAILDNASDLTAVYQQAQAAYMMLESTSVRLPGYVIASQDFRLRWEETKLQIQEQMEELESMRIFYESYHSSYDNLILEIARRRQVEDKIKGVMKKAMKQVDDIAATDTKERADFKIEVGDFLPVDLYPDVNLDMRKWHFTVDRREAEAMSGGRDGNHGIGEGQGSIPWLTKDVVDAAARRARDRARTENE